MWRDRLFKEVDQKYGPAIDLFRGNTPRSVMDVLIALETGGNQFSVSTDVVLIELGATGCPILEFWRGEVDPFSINTNVWVGCLEAIRDAKKYLEKIPGLTPRDLWYFVYLDYAIGGYGVKHIINVVGSLPGTGSWMDRAIAWSNSDNFFEASHRKYWGRQSPRIVRKRILKQKQRLEWAEQLGPIDGKPGPVCPEKKQDGMQGFPLDLEDAARVSADKTASHALHVQKHAEVVAYAKKRQKESVTPKLSLRSRIAAWVHKQPRFREERA